MEKEIPRPWGCGFFDHRRGWWKQLEWGWATIGFRCKSPIQRILPNSHLNGCHWCDLLIHWVRFWPSDLRWWQSLRNARTIHVLDRYAWNTHQFVHLADFFCEFRIWFQRCLCMDPNSLCRLNCVYVSLHWICLTRHVLWCLYGIPWWRLFRLIFIVELTLTIMINLEQQGHWCHNSQAVPT